MTWTKLPTSYSDDLASAGLTDAAYRTHTEAIQWLYHCEIRTGRIPKHIVRRFASSPDYEQAIKDLLALGYWADDVDTYTLIQHAAVIAESLEAQESRKASNKRAQQAYRDKRKPVSADDDAGVSADVGTRGHADVSADVSAPDSNNHPSIQVVSSTGTNLKIRTEEDLQTARAHARANPRLAESL
jgi:hypothetical protein